MIDPNLTITVTAVAAANRLRNSPRGVIVNRRRRERWAVALKREGKTYYTVGDKHILSDAFHPVILPRGCMYSWECMEAGECLLVEFDAPQEHREILSFTVQDNSFFQNAFLQIQKKLHDPAPEARLECMHLLYGLLLQLVKSTAKEYVPREKQLLLRPAVDYMAECYYESGITNDLLAGMCGISTVHFRKTFEAVYGISPIRYLHELRTRKAKDILSSDYGSVSQVAESVGYTSVYHFSKMFKTYTGKSPSEYAKTSRE